MDPLDVFSLRLRMRRNEKRITQGKLGDSIGVSAATISAYENEDKDKRKSPSFENAISIARVLGVSLDWLCGIEDEQNMTEREIIFKALLSISYLKDTFGDDLKFENFFGSGLFFSNSIDIGPFLNELLAIWEVYNKNKSLDQITYKSILKVICNKHADHLVGKTNQNAETSDTDDI